MQVGSSPSRERKNEPARLKTRRDFLRVQRGGARYKGHLIVLMTRTVQGLNGGGRFGLVTPKTIGKAHDRNRIKRRLRHIISLVPEILVKQDIVLLASAACIDASFEQFKSDVINAGRQIKGRPERHRSTRAAHRPTQTSTG